MSRWSAADWTLFACTVVFVAAVVVAALCRDDEVEQDRRKFRKMIERWDEE